MPGLLAEMSSSPILQSTGGTSGFAGITIQFKEFGVRLNFTPTLTPDGLIHLKVKPEVKSLDFTNALTLQRASDYRRSRQTRVESEMDLNDGQSFRDRRLDGQSRDRAIGARYPGIGDIPDA